MDKKFKIIIVVMASVLIFILAVIFFRMKYVIDSSEGLAYPNISINSIDISGLNKEEAHNKLEGTLKQFNEKRLIRVSAGEGNYEVSFMDLNIRENLDEVIDTAINYGKSDSFIERYKHCVKGVDREFITSVTIDDEAFKKFTAKIKKEQEMSPINALIEHDWSGFKVTPHELGRKLEEDKLKQDIRQTLDEATGDEVVYVNAEFSVEYPRIMTEQLESIDTLISSYTTNFASSTEGRVRNIELAAKYLNGFVVLPGEEFSFNKVVGATTSGKGFQFAKVIRNGQYADEIGGGVCQVSSTLYNALLMSRLEITERRNHSKAINYVPMGRDAMISYGASDLKFINNYSFPIMIESVISGKQITFNLFSNSSEKTENYQIVTEVQKEIQPKRETIYDYGLSEGTVIVQQHGKIGYVIDTYRVLYHEGKVAEKYKVGESIYPGKNTIVRIGKD